MHPAWQIDDIRFLIFEYLESQSLARLAQTSKGFYDFAIDELWKTIRSFSPLLGCLPPGFRTEPLRQEDIDRLDFYSAKIQHVILEGQDMQKPIRLPPSFNLKKNDPRKSWVVLWDEVAKLRSSSEFLPNVRRIRINSVAEDYLIPLVGISGSNLSQIYIKNLHPNRKVGTVALQMLNRLRDTPKLESLVVRPGEPGVPSWLIRQSPLKHLRLDPRIKYRWDEEPSRNWPLRPEIIQKSTLKNLSLAMTRNWSFGEVGALISKEKYLPALKTLWLNLSTLVTEGGAVTWRNKMGITGRIRHLTSAEDELRLSPIVFLDQLDNPELDLLNIKFPSGITEEAFLEVVTAVNNSCRLRNLTEFGLAGGNPESNAAPLIKPQILREALQMSLPMPQLKTLRISVAPDFLDILDLDLYKSMADGIPALERLWLGHAWFYTQDRYSNLGRCYEKAPLHHLAAFSSMFAKLHEVSIGSVDCATLEQSPRAQWASPGVTSLKIGRCVNPRYTDRDPLQAMLSRSLQAYFPNSDLAKQVDMPYIWQYYE